MGDIQTSDATEHRYFRQRSVEEPAAAKTKSAQHRFERSEHKEAARGSGKRALDEEAGK